MKWLSQTRPHNDSHRCISTVISTKLKEVTEYCKEEPLNIDIQIKVQTEGGLLNYYAEGLTTVTATYCEHKHCFLSRGYPCDI